MLTPCTSILSGQKLNEEVTNPEKAIEKAIRQIGPACAVSSLTTAAALASLCASGNNGLFELGVIGALAVMAGYVCIIVALPLGCLWASRSGFAPKKSLANALSGIAKPALTLLKHRTLVLVIGAIVCVIGLYAHYAIDSRFRLI